MSAIGLLLDAMTGRWSVALDEWTVTYGWDATQNTGNYLMIGADDPFRTEGEAATSSQDFATATKEGVTETGYITCVAFSWNGAHDGQRQATTAVLDALRVIEADMHANPRLGIEPTPYFAVESLTIESANLHHGLDADGSRALLTIRINFEAYRRIDL